MMRLPALTPMILALVGTFALSSTIVVAAGTPQTVPPSSPTVPPTTAETTTTLAPTTTTTTAPPTTTTLPPTTTTSTSTTVAPATTTTRPRSTTTSTTVRPTTTTSTTTPVDTFWCSPPTTTTTTTTTTLPPGVTTTTTTTTTTTLPPGATTTSTTTTTTTTLPPCPTTSVAATSTTTTLPTTTIAPAPLNVQVPSDLADILLTIRTVESGERYSISPNRGGASGAYQYIDSTWNNYKGYPQAYLAPAWVQDERALADVQAILARWAGDVSMVPVIWYYPKAARQPELMDQVPLPGAGNRLTVREYQQRWLDVLSFITGNPSLYRPAALPPELRFLAGQPPELRLDASPDDIGEIAFPVLGRAVMAIPNPCRAEECDNGTDAIVYGQQLQPILAVRDGVVTSVVRLDPLTGGSAVTITDEHGRTYRYTGFNDDSFGTHDGAAHPSLRLTSLVRIGGTVRAGQIIGFMGDTDPMPSSGEASTDPDAQVWPHLRLVIRDADGNRLDADLLVAEAQARQACHVGIGPWSLGPNPAWVGDREPAAFDVTAYNNGGWTFHADGSVTAYGRSALVLAPQDCSWAPVDPHGYGGRGEPAPLEWFYPIQLDAALWVNSVMAEAALSPTLLLRRG